LWASIDKMGLDKIIIKKMSELLVWCVGLVKTKKFNGLHLRARDPTTKKKKKEK
jgi:hypothetical protein